MKFSRVVLLILSMGLISSIAIVYFYLLQRDFTKNHREFLISINKMENVHAQLTYSILQNSIFAYYNQDKIAKESTLIRIEYEALKNTKLLKKDKYEPVLKHILSLKAQLNSNLQDIEDYLMLNAGIRNSLIFMARHVENATLLDKKDKTLYVSSNQILKSFNDTMTMQDLDYIKNKKILLESASQDAKTIDFIHNFNMHSKHLNRKLPLFLKKTKHILDNNINSSIYKARTHFSNLAVDDFDELDIFAAILFSIFIISIMLILFLIVKYFNENKNLLNTKNSLEYTMNHDILTGLYNRKAFTDMLDSLSSPHLILLNIDNFKDVNDIYGNETGDIILQLTTDILRLQLSNVEKANIYRIGADEFAILFEKIDAHKALNIAKIIEQYVAHHNFDIGEEEINITISIASNNILPILENADLALKQIKKDFTNRIIEYNDGLNLKEDVEKNFKTIEIIKNAIHEDRVIPYFQPIINLKTSRIEKYEALVRIKMPDGSLLSPFFFLETSKKTSYYQQITQIMIEKTLKVAELYPAYRFSMNISMIDILNKEITDMLIEKLSSNPIVASRLDIELLESESLENISKVQEFIKKVHSYGSKILIDDFGSGYSNFAYFSNLDVDIVKIDGSIVKEINVNDRQLHMLQSIYNFSKGMNMNNVAEFIETREHAVIIRDMGIEYGQGYYFSPPVEKPLDYDEVVI